MIKVTYTENTDINVDFTSVQSLKIRYTAIERIVETTAIPTHFNTVFKKYLGCSPKEFVAGIKNK